MNQQAGPGLPPPLPNLLGFVLGLICDWLWPWPIARYVYVLPVGVLLAFLVAVPIATGLRAFKLHELRRTRTKRQRRSLTQDHSASRAIRAILPYRFFKWPWIAFQQHVDSADAPPALIVVHYVIVLGEEAYLERKFGDSYLDYKSRFRRWI